MGRIHRHPATRSSTRPSQTVCRGRRSSLSRSSLHLALRTACAPIRTLLHNRSAILFHRTSDRSARALHQSLLLDGTYSGEGGNVNLVLTGMDVQIRGLRGVDHVLIDCRQSLDGARLPLPPRRASRLRRERAATAKVFGRRAGAGDALGASAVLRTLLGLEVAGGRGEARRFVGVRWSSSVSAEVPGTTPNFIPA